MPLRSPASDEVIQYLTIYATAPTYAYPIMLSPYADRELAVRVAKAELKLAMIEALTNGTWEYEKA